MAQQCSHMQLNIIQTHTHGTIAWYNRGTLQLNGAFHSEFHYDVHRLLLSKSYCNIKGVKAA